MSRILQPNALSTDTNGTNVVHLIRECLAEARLDTDNYFIRQGTIGPEAARWILENLNKDPGQRPICERDVQMYVADIYEGRWVQKMVHSIQFKPNGWLGDGQHRLTAVARTGITVNFIIAFNADNTAVDQGRPRNSATVARSLGYKDASRASAVANMMMHYFKGRWQQGHLPGNGKVAKGEFMARGDVRRSIVDALAIAEKTTGIRVTSSLVPAIVAISAWPDLPSEYPLAVDFCHAVATGENLSSTNPAFRLREYCRGLNDKGHSVASEGLRLVSTKAWNAAVAGLELRVLKRTQGEMCQDIRKLSQP